MRTEKLDVSAAIELGQRLPYAMVRSLSSMFLGQTPAVILPEELEEARFFSEKEEIRVFHSERGLSAVLVTEEEGDVVLQSWERVENPTFGKELRITRLLERDEDGQAYVADMRLSGWKGGNEVG